MTWQNWQNNIPEEFHGVVRDFAWEQAHSYGEDEVNNLCAELAEYMKPAIEKFGARRFNEGQWNVSPVQKNT